VGWGTLPVKLELAISTNAVVLAVAVTDAVVV
jgi:hypothetical protein